MKTSFTRQRPFTVAWSGLLAALLVLGSLTSFAGGACENATQWPTSAVTVTGTDVITINGCNYEEEYSQITGIQAGASYEFTADGPSTYITIRQGSVGGTVLAAGFSPLTGVAATADDIYVHWSADASCATAASCITTTVQDVTPPCENSSQWPTSTYDVSAGSGVQSINTCVFAGDYSVVTGLTSGNYYQITVEGGNYITVREGAVDGPVVAEGTGITALVSSGADLYIHYNTEAISCGTASTCLEATIEDQGVPPCENTSAFGSATASAVDGETVLISGVLYAGSEVSTVDGIQNGYQYQVTHEAGSYITVRSGAPDGPVLASGFSPLDFSGGADGTVYIHWTVDETCATDATGSWDGNITSIGFPDCENASLWPSSAVTAGAAGAGPVNISTNQYSSGEYSIVTGIVASSEYEITHANGVFITVREGAVDGPVIASGFSPLIVATATTADLYIHWNEDQGCSEDLTGSYLTTIENLGVACVADAGTITADVDELCFDTQAGTVTITATPDGNQLEPAGFTTLYVLTDGSDPSLPILDIQATPSFDVTAVGDYIIHTFILDPADQATYLAETTGAGVAALLLENGGTLCGSLDVTGAPVAVLDCPDNDLCEDAIPVACGDVVDGTTVNGTLSPAVTTAGIGVWYTFEGNGQDVTFSTCDAADFDTEITVLTGADCNSLTTFDSNDDGSGCTGFTSELTIYAEYGTTYYVYVSHFSNSSTTTGDFTLSVTCACPPSLDAGTLTADASTVCLDGGSADLSATEGTAPGVPAGYDVTYVLTSGGTDYVIEAVNTTPDFTVTAAGEYTIHTLVSTGTLDLSGVVFGTTTAADVIGIVTGDDNICAALDVTGTGSILVEGPTAGTLSAVETPVCLVGGSADIAAIEGDAPTVPTDYQVLYVLTEGAGLVIVDAGATPDFTVTAEGDYTIHTLVYNPATLDLSGVVFGTTTGFDVNGLLVQGGGSICGALDVTGAPITVEDCTPANDLCSNAQALSCGDVVAGTNVGATEQTIPTYNGGTAGNGVWYTFTGTGGDVTLSTCDDATFDTEINVLTTSDCSTFTNVAGNDDGTGCTGFTSEITFTTAVGETYYVYVSEYSSGGGDEGTFNLSFTCDPVTGISEALDNGMIVYPNPSNGAFVVEITGVESMAQINVLDLTGRVVYTEGAMLNGNFRKDVNLNVASGTYLLQVITEEGMVTRKLQVK